MSEIPNNEKNAKGNAKSHNKTVKKLMLVVLAMFGFGFALVPLYDVFCDITGLNGKTKDSAVIYKAGVDLSRTVTVQFITRNSQGMSWQFTPVINEMSVHPGEKKIVTFYAKNNTDHFMTGKAVPSVSPGMAANYFNKIECFCFTHQSLKAGEEVEMSLEFYVDVDLPKEMNTLTLSYTLYDITNESS
jgi:cytochrome c oxidase assembly protein subunit 11